MGRRSFLCHASDPAESGSNQQESSIAARIAAAKKYKESMSAASGVSTQQTFSIPKPTLPQSSILPPAPAPNFMEVSNIGHREELLSQSQNSSPLELMDSAPTVSQPSLHGMATQNNNQSTTDASKTSQNLLQDSYQPSFNDQQNLPQLTPPQNVVPFLDRTPDASLPSTELAALIFNATQAPGRGSAIQAEPSLASVLRSDSNLDANLRPEEFTLQKEERMKQMGAQIITVDQTYNPGASMADSTQLREAKSKESASSSKYQGSATSPTNTSNSASGSTIQVSDEVLYQPKVSTWGAFPRPNNISEAYGGGRNIAPGQALESEDQKAAREAAFNAAMKSYREKMGLDVDPELEEGAMVLYEEGMELFKTAQLKAAYEKFNEAMKMVPVRTKVGGMATLQKAIILDSNGESDEARKLYKQLRGHAVASVAKKAKQMAFGFEAASFLKADTISYSAKKTDYIKFFRAFADRNKIYIASKEDKRMDEELNRISTAIAMGVLLGPLALVGSLVARQHVM
ncbi:hypothetical protein CEUSTIGMA_g4613.t1 [Chlamydomonas eustigma]|uniref:Uncharacterized protein n=1 Tax=Chlamydomonas eustigma TaxID=1157962 RepID=A0A250X273_9CHLO|nr:hypothetical protein CEUSTIGMA_g4613.t1 [Chlamydomonas eustigma]|eukprot:GAX77168.1 hypothetical protein CEUSTIGMA_g4613.t1 [Chlamydomonas eustigma]